MRAVALASPPTTPQGADGPLGETAGTNQRPRPSACRTPDGPAAEQSPRRHLHAPAARIPTTATASATGASAAARQARGRLHRQRTHPALSWSPTAQMQIDRYNSLIKIYQRPGQRPQRPRSPSATCSSPPSAPTSSRSPAPRRKETPRRHRALAPLRYSPISFLSSATAVLTEGSVSLCQLNSPQALLVRLAALLRLPLRGPTFRLAEVVVRVPILTSRTRQSAPASRSSYSRSRLPPRAASCSWSGDSRSRPPRRPAPGRVVIIRSGVLDRVVQQRQRAQPGHRSQRNTCVTVSATRTTCDTYSVPPILARWCLWARAANAAAS